MNPNPIATLAHISITPDALDVTASRFSKSSLEIERLVGSLQRLVQSLEGDWRGASSAQFLATWTRIAQRLHLVPVEGQRTSQLLKEIALSFRAADSRPLGSRLGPGPVAGPFPVPPGASHPTVTPIPPALPKDGGHPPADVHPGSHVVDVVKNWKKSPPADLDRNGTHDWDYWCLGFVNRVVAQANGKTDPALTAETAKASYNLMHAAGRIHGDLKSMTAGSALFWPNASEWGHIAIFSGQYTSTGDPIIITTTGWPGRSGIQEIPLGVLKREIGVPAGWAQV